VLASVAGYYTFFQPPVPQPHSLYVVADATCSTSRPYVAGVQALAGGEVDEVTPGIWT